MDEVTSELDELSEDAAALAEARAMTDAFNGESDGTPRATETPPGDAPKDDPTTGTTEPAKKVEPVEKVAASEVVQVPKTDWDSLVAKAARIDEIERAAGTARDQVFGKVGRLEETVRAMQTRGAAKVSDEELKAFADEYPDLAKTAVFQKLLASAPTATEVGAKPVLDEAAIEKLVQQRVEPAIRDAEMRTERAVETRLLTAAHKDWREVIGMPANPGEAPPETDYRRWLKAQPADYQTQVGSSWDHAVIGSSIEKFRKAQAEANAAAKAADAAAAQAKERQARLAAAVPVRGETATTRTGGEDEETAAMNAAFKGR